MKISLMSGLLLVGGALVAGCSSVAAQNYITGHVVDASNGGLKNIPVTVRDEYKNLLGSGATVEGGAYTVPFTSSKKIRVSYGNLQYPIKTIMELSGQRNHDVTIVLGKELKREDTRGQGAEEDDEARIRTGPSELWLTLDESLFPVELRAQILQTRAATTELIRRDSGRSRVRGSPGRILFAV